MVNPSSTNKRAEPGALESRGPKRFEQSNLPSAISDYLDAMPQAFRQALRLVERGEIFRTHSFGPILVKSHLSGISFEHFTGKTLEGDRRAQDKSFPERLPDGLLMVESKTILPDNVDFDLLFIQRERLCERSVETLTPSERKSLERVMSFQRLVEELEIAKRVIEECEAGTLLHRLPRPKPGGKRA